MNRREFLHALGAGAAASGIGAFPAFGQTAAPLQLRASSRSLDIKGRAAKVFGLLQPDGTQGVTLKAKQAFNVELTNTLDEPTIIHWHGQTPPWPQDGVPDNPLPLLKTNEMRAYKFASNPGTHWMHAHTLQEQNLLAAPLIVQGETVQDEQEVVILLHDFSFKPAAQLLAKLKGSAGVMPMNHGGMDMSKMDMSKMDMGKMDMPMDVNDIDYDAYLANDRTLHDPQVVSVEKSGRVRLRIINGATATAFTIDTGALDAALIAVDGQDILPFKAKMFPVSMGQRLDIRVELPASGGAFPILALREGAVERTGIILKTPQAQVSKLALTGKKAPAISLDMETRLVAAQPLAKRKADKTFHVTLMGNMASYDWGMTGADALKVKQGERVEIMIHNMSMMTHPMHLHGHHFQMIDINGQAINGAVRDTVALTHMSSVTLAFDANNPGVWPFHCHHLYHMASGMMAFLKYDGVG